MDFPPGIFQSMSQAVSGDSGMNLMVDGVGSLAWQCKHACFNEKFFLSALGATRLVYIRVYIFMYTLWACVCLCVCVCLSVCLCAHTKRVCVCLLSVCVIYALLGGCHELIASNAKQVCGGPRGPQQAHSGQGPLFPHALPRAIRYIHMHVSHTRNACIHVYVYIHIHIYVSYISYIPMRTSAQILNSAILQ
jgi:hypothetical protein